MFIALTNDKSDRIHSINIFHITDFTLDDCDINKTNIFVVDQPYAIVVKEDYNTVFHKINQAKEEYYQALEGKRRLPHL